MNRDDLIFYNDNELKDYINWIFSTYSHLNSYECKYVKKENGIVVVYHYSCGTAFEVQLDDILKMQIECPYCFNIATHVKAIYKRIRWCCAKNNLTILKLDYSKDDGFTLITQCKKCLAKRKHTFSRGTVLPDIYDYKCNICEINDIAIEHGFFIRYDGKPWKEVLTPGDAVIICKKCGKFIIEETDNIDSKYFESLSCDCNDIEDEYFNKTVSNEVAWLIDDGILSELNFEEIYARQNITMPESKKQFFTYGIFDNEKQFVVLTVPDECEGDTVLFSIDIEAVKKGYYSSSVLPMSIIIKWDKYLHEFKKAVIKNVEHFCTDSNSKLVLDSIEGYIPIANKLLTQKEIKLYSALLDANNILRKFANPNDNQSILSMYLSSHRCPICGSWFFENEEKCSVCNYYGITKVFRSEAEKLDWVERVEEPYREKYNRNAEFNIPKHRPSTDDDHYSFDIDEQELTSQNCSSDDDFFDEDFNDSSFFDKIFEDEYYSSDDF